MLIREIIKFLLLLIGAFASSYMREEKKNHLYSIMQLWSVRNTVYIAILNNMSTLIDNGNAAINYRLYLSQAE